MNILFFLTPKAMCAYIESDDTLRQAMERMEHSGYAALPVLDKSGKYCGVVTEGDLLWTLKRLCVMDLRQTEEHSISEIEHRRTVQPVRVDTRVEDLISVAAEQNFVPVIDDKGDFIGIVTRRENWAPMRENSTVIFLRRPLDQLPLDGRPVSQANPLEELYEKRLPLYEKAADLTVDNDQVDRAVDEIIRRLKL